MKYVILFVVTFLVVYLLYLCTVILNKKKLKKFPKSNQVIFFVKKYGIKVDNSNSKELANLIALTNSLIISITITVIELIPNFILKILVAFPIILILILVLYDIIGKTMLKRGKK